MKVEQKWCDKLKCPRRESCSFDPESVCGEFVKLSTQSGGEDNVSKSTRMFSDVLLKIMSKCIQRGTDQRTVGHYVITSGEMSRMSAGEEIHILSNEYLNYDYTPISTLAIALNTQKGVHYYYYGTEEQESVVMALRERVKGYYQKGWKAKDKIARWIRKAKSSLYNYQDFLRGICGYSIGNIIESIVMGSNIAGEEKKEVLCSIIGVIKNTGKEKDYLMPSLANLTYVLDWINGIESSQNDSIVYNFINEIAILIKGIKNNEELMRDIFVKDFCDKIQLLLDMKEFSIWLTKDASNPAPDRINYLFNVFQYKNNNAIGDQFNVLISDPMKKWLSPSDGETNSGMISCDDTDMDTWANNIHFCVLRDENPYTLCYSFTLFLGVEGQAAAWYTTYKENSNTDDSALDNPLLMIDILRNDPLLKEIEFAFKDIITQDENVKKLLRDSNSRIIDFLEIK